MSVQVLRAHPRTVTPSDGETTEVPKLRACAYARIGYDNEMVIRYLDKVIVNDQDYEVRFKGGVSMTV